jgi:hypothetical protein
MITPKLDYYDGWTIITGVDTSTANGKQEGSSDPITGKKYEFYGEARKELPADHWIFHNLYKKVGKIIASQKLRTVYGMNPSYKTQGKSGISYLSVGFRRNADSLRDLDSLTTFLEAKPADW